MRKPSATSRISAYAFLALALSPDLLSRHCGIKLDPWQLAVLQSDARRILVVCHRQAGKSFVAALKALHTALFRSQSLVLIAAPSQRQSTNLLRLILEVYDRCVQPVPIIRKTIVSVEFSNRSRIVAVPGSESTIRGYSSVDLLVVDEASRVPDILFQAVLPMLVVSDSQLIALSTPNGQFGWFYDAYLSSGIWEKYKVAIAESARIDKKNLDNMRQMMPAYMYEQEFNCEFNAAPGQVFSTELIASVFDDDVKPLFES